MTDSPHKRRGVSRALQHPPYRLYAAGNAISLIGTWMQRLGIGWLTWELTGSGFWLGLVAFADLFPTVVLAPLAGTIADTGSRLKIMRFTQILSLVQAGLFAILAIAGLLDIWSIFVLALFLGVVSAFDQPARLSLIASLIPREDLPSAVAVNSIIFNLARFVGPAIGGALLAWRGPETLFVLNALSYALFVVMLFRLNVETPVRIPEEEGSFFRRLASGLLILFHNPGLRIVIVMLVCLTVGVRPIAEMLPGFAAQIFSVGPNGLAAMTAAMGLGSVIGGLWINSEKLASQLSRMLLVNSATLGLAVAGFATTANFWIALPCLVLAGFGMSRTAIAAQTALHLSVEEAQRGRVLSIYGMIFRGGPALGALITGLASAWFGLQTPILCGVLALSVGWIWVFVQRYRVAAALEGNRKRA